MATITETKVVQVTTIDTAGYAKSFNLDNPKDNLTLAQIKQAFQIGINAGWWLGASGAPVAEVQKATYSTSTKIPISGGEISVTPSKWDFASGPPNATFTTEGEAPTALRIVDSNVTSNNNATWQWYNMNINGQTVTLSGTSLNAPQGETTFTGTATLQIWFGNYKVDIPLTVNITMENA